MLFINNKATEKHNMPQIIKGIQNPHIAAIKKKHLYILSPISSIHMQQRWILHGVNSVNML